ncbi:hypothetical protein BVRB_6g153910 isoform A [Beta vulgaris subsp. vulgaris]|nr:hypothetical protein BVRB_6g153910 isoform A [Beta vulgaris subsp. vulgaris]
MPWHNLFFISRMNTCASVPRNIGRLQSHESLSPKVESCPLTL